MHSVRFSASIAVEREPAAVYALVTDISRTGEWSPVCAGCWWDEGATLGVGAWFTGRNVTPARTWETRSQVIVADPAQEFAFLVGQGWARWGFTFSAAPWGTTVTESWVFTPVGLAGFRDRYGAEADAQIAERTQAAHLGIPASLAALKRVAEAT